MKRILICGDSWGLGEWKYPPERHTSNINHPGIEQYLIEENYSVVNVSKPAISNYYCINILEDLDLSTFDKILWFQTDPIRDLRPYSDKRFVDSINDREKFINLQNDLLENSYERLNSFNKNILCLGGASKLNLELIEKFENLIPAIPAITEFFYPNYKHPEIFISDWIHNIKSNASLDFLEPEKIKQDYISSEEFKEFFFPDGIHPNRKAHKILTEFIIPNFLN